MKNSFKRTFLQKNTEESNSIINSKNISQDKNIKKDIIPSKI